MSAHPHNPTVALWGGPLDGLSFEGTEGSKFIVPPLWHRGYRRSVVEWHADLSACTVKYIWREVWEDQS